VKTYSRIVMFSNSAVDNKVFSKLMNSVFVLEHKQIILDVIEFSGQPQDYLLQSAQKTNGVYIVHQPSASSPNSCFPNREFPQYIMQVLTIGNSQREAFKMPYQSKTNFSGTCTCHNERIEFAWVCSICLGIYCQASRDRVQGKCRFCHEKYDPVNFNQKLLLE
jgi:transcription initiation factor TFIIH subunit 3